MTDAIPKVTRTIGTGSELTIYSVSQAKVELLAPLPAPGCLVEIDLQSVTELDTAGVQLLIVAHRHVSECGGEFRIANVRPEVRATLDMLCLGPLLGMSE